MKLAAKVYRWIIISVILQVLILTYINNVFLNKSGTVTATIVEVEDNKPKADMATRIPSQAEKVKVSYDGSYVSYLLGEKLEIVDIKERKVIKTLTHEKLYFSYYSWLPDRDMIIYAMKAAPDQPGEVYIYTYDVEGELERNYPKIGGLPKESKITDIELSPLTNVVYAKIKVGQNQYKICKFDIMDTLSYIMNTNYDIVIKEAGYNDILIYQDDKNKIYARDALKYSTTQLQFKNRTVLLGIDADDQVYTGELQSDDKVSTVYYGKLNEDVNKQWKKIVLNGSYAPEQLSVTPEGAIYRLEEQENSIYNAATNKKIQYKGKFIEVCDGFIVSMEKDSLRVSPIE